MDNIKKITQKDLQSYNEIMMREKQMMETIFSSNKDIYKVYYTDKVIIIQFKNGKHITSEYLNSLNELIEYKEYNIEVTTITEEFFKITYTEQVLQLNIFI